MNDLETFFGRLVVWEGQRPMPLVARWNPRDAEQVEAALRRAVNSCAFGSTPLRAGPSVSNQSIGNRLASFVSTEVNRHLKGFRIDRCRGPGYPDARLVRGNDNRAFALEFKATQEFDRRDNNRIVLTCTSAKLRRHFEPPISHLFAIILYERVGRKLWVRSVRLEFLDPQMPVNVRLEGSVTKRLLAARVKGSKLLCVKLPRARRNASRNKNRKGRPQ